MRMYFLILLANLWAGSISYQAEYFRNERLLKKIGFSRWQGLSDSFFLCDNYYCNIVL